MVHNFKWEPSKDKYVSGENLRLGAVIVGTVFFSGMVSRSDPNKYECSCLLPGIRQPKNRYPTMEAAKERLENMVGVWLSWIESE